MKQIIKHLSTLALILVFALYSPNVLSQNGTPKQTKTQQRNKGENTGQTGNAIQTQTKTQTRTKQDENAVNKKKTQNTSTTI